MYKLLQTAGFPVYDHLRQPQSQSPRVVDNFVSITRGNGIVNNCVGIAEFLSTKRVVVCVSYKIRCDTSLYRLRLFK